jgi:hypothetical protein
MNRKGRLGREADEGGRVGPHEGRPEELGMMISGLHQIPRKAFFLRRKGAS